MSRMRLLTSLSAVVFAVLVAQPAQADRRHGLAESELIEDKDDVFVYPARAADYTNLVSFEYGPDAEEGTALGLFGGETYGIGVAFRRGDLFEMSGLQSSLGRAGSNPAGTPSSITPQDFDFDLGHSFPQRLGADIDVGRPSTPANSSEEGVQGGVESPRPHMLFDVVGGYDLGKGKIGGRFSLGAGGEEQDDIDEEASSQGELYFLFKGGYSGSFGDTTLDTALSFAVNQGDENALDSGDNVREGNVTGVTFEGRLNQQMSDTVALGSLLDVGYTAFNFREDGQDPTIERSFSQFAIQGGAGPVFEVGSAREEESSGAASMDTEGDDETSEPPSKSGTASESGSENESSKTTDFATPTPEEPPPAAPAGVEDSFEQGARIAGYTVLGYRSFGGDPNSEEENDEFTYHGALLPGLHLAGEFHILEWLYVRSGAQYWFLHLRQSVATEEGEGDNNVNLAGADTSGLGWSAGLGFEVGDFRFDGSLSRNFLRNGPQFLGGAGAGLFATASAQYEW